MIKRNKMTGKPKYVDRRKTLAWINHRHLGIDGRRSVDAVNRYVDWYRPGLLVAALIILTCSILDAALTLDLLSRGASELNIFMAVLIEKDIDQFFIIKLSLTCLSIVFLVVHKNFRIYNNFLVAHFIYLFAFLYTGLIGYELLLLA